MDGKIFLRAAGRLPQAAKDEMFGKLFGELVSNIPRAFLHTHRTLHHAHTVAITVSFLCGFDLLSANPQSQFLLNIVAHDQTAVTSDGQPLMSLQL